MVSFALFFVLEISDLGFCYFSSHQKLADANGQPRIAVKLVID